MDKNFLIRTDHSALQWLVSFRNIQDQLARWFQKLQQYVFNVVHHAGKNHQNADALSHHPCLLSGCRFYQKLDKKNEVFNDCKSTVPLKFVQLE